MDHRISLTQVTGLSQLSNMLTLFKNASFLLAAIINLVILLSYTTEASTGELGFNPGYDSLLVDVRWGKECATLVW